MTPPRIHALRLTFERLYPAHARSLGHPGPPLHALLAVPLPERLILLALIDHAPAEEIRRTLKATSEDLTLTSDRMRQADFRRHYGGQDTFYFTGAERRDQPAVLVMIESDVHPRPGAPAAV